MSESPEVAVVCCFLDAAPFLGEAIESVLAQTYSDWQLVLVDDGSTDGSTDIARSYAARDPRILYRDHPGHANLGLSASRNFGIAASCAPLVALIDADDAWLPEKLAEQVAIFARHPELAMVAGASFYRRAGVPDVRVAAGHAEDRVIPPPEALIEIYPLGRAQAPPPSVLMLRRGAVERVGGFEPQFSGAYALYEDQALLAKLYLTGAVYFSSQVWLRYRLHPDSISARVTGSGRYHEVRRYFLDWLAGYLNRHGPVPPKVWRALGRARRPYRFPGGTWLKDRPRLARLAAMLFG